MIEEKHFGPVWFIPGENKGRYPFCHSIYIEGAGILIDPSSDRERLKRLKEESGVNEIWLSHWHEDHFMYLDLFDDLPLSMMEPDALPLSGIEQFLDAYGVQDQYRDGWRSDLNEMLHFKPRTPDHFLKDGQWIDLDSTRVKVISAPGHTPGHMALFFETPGVLFIGDYDLTRFGPWYADTDSSIEDVISSVNALRKIPAEIWITSHETGLFEHEPGELWDNYLEVIKTREEKLLALLETPKTIHEIGKACIIYKKPREPEHAYLYGEIAHMQKHLDILMQKGSVVYNNDKYALAR